MRQSDLAIAPNRSQYCKLHANLCRAHIAQEWGTGIPMPSPLLASKRPCKPILIAFSSRISHTFGLLARSGSSMHSYLAWFPWKFHEAKRLRADCVIWLPGYYCFGLRQKRDATDRGLCPSVAGFLFCRVLGNAGREHPIACASRP
jgi:hypothetical protein